jgi:hypothetical protein
MLFSQNKLLGKNLGFLPMRKKRQKMSWIAIQNTKEVLGGHLMFFLQGWKHEEKCQVVTQCSLLEGRSKKKNTK